MALAFIGVAAVVKAVVVEAVVRGCLLRPRSLAEGEADRFEGEVRFCCRCALEK